MMPRRVRLHARGKYGTARKPEEVPRGFFYNFFYFLWMNPIKEVGDPSGSHKSEKVNPNMREEQEYSTQGD